MLSNQDEIMEEIKNETRMIDKVAAGGGNTNLIRVLKHAWLNDERYYIDMEMCILNLEDYILGDFKSVFGISKYLDPHSTKCDLGCLSLWAILQSIANGLAFIHSHGELHRDLKPRNGNSHCI